MTEHSAAPSLIDQVIDGRYRMERLIGSGGMGDVYFARHLRTHRPVAIKLLAANVTSEPGILQRFELEATTLGAIGHPHIVGVHDFAELPDGRPYLVMDYLEGEELADRLDRGGRLDWPQAQRIFSETASALFAAHRARVLHRDLKPGNIFLTRATGAPERVVLLDFGLAKDIAAEELRLTQTGVIMGTPLYMSPEQAQGKELREQSDIYALAAVLFEMLTGRTPFEGQTWTAVLTALLVEPPPTITGRVAADVPPHLDEVLRRALAKNPDERYPDALAFATAVLGRTPEWGTAVPAEAPARRAPLGTGPITDPGRITTPEDAAVLDQIASAMTVPSSPPKTYVPPNGLETDGASSTGTTARASRRSLGLIVGLVLAALVGAALTFALTRPTDHEASRKETTAGTPGTPPGDAAPQRVQPQSPASTSVAVDATAPAAPLAMAARVPPVHTRPVPVPAPPPTMAARPRPRTMRPAPRRAPMRRASTPVAMRPAQTMTKRAAAMSPPPGPPRLPSAEARAIAAMRKSDWAACIKATRQGPTTSRLLQMRVSCAWSARRYGTVKRACKTHQARYPSHPFSRSCKSMLRAIGAIQKARMRP